MLNICRALQGIGPAAFLPASVALLSKVYRPGPRKNIVFSIYGAMAPVGFFVGIAASGVSAGVDEKNGWRGYFWVGAGLVFLATIMGIWAVPRDSTFDTTNAVGMDWLGTVTIIGGLVLTTASITESPKAPSGWGTWYIIFLFVVGVVFLGAAAYVEGWVAKTPLLPFDMFAVKGMLPLSIALFFSYGVFGTWLFYTTF